jgi:integrase/recombinase XerD
MLTIYRRHRKNCSHHNEGRAYRRCHCPIWADGMLGGQEVRKSLGMRDGQKARDYVREWEARETEPKSTSEPMAVQQAKEKYLADAAARCLNESTIYRYRLLFKRIGDFAQKRGLRYLKELDLETLDTFRSEWKDGPRSNLKKLEGLRAFLRFTEKRKWIDNNPATELKAPKVPNKPTMPFTREEMICILTALEPCGESAGIRNAQRLRTFVLLLRYSGLRIGDAVQLDVNRIQKNKLLLHTEKTGVAVYCVLPDMVVKALDAAPHSSARYFFWTGKSTVRSAKGKWQRRLQRLFKFAKVQTGQAHRLRDTFAVELLLADVPLDRVSVLLGHSSIRITERHYAPWTGSRQEQIEADLKAAWSNDPVVLSDGKGTELAGKTGQIN